MGAQVKKTVSSRKDLRPHTSDNAPISGALRNDNRPWRGTKGEMGEEGGCIRGAERKKLRKNNERDKMFKRMFKCST